MTKHTLMESVIERRNYYQGRLVEYMVNVVYFTKVLEKTKPDTQERINAKESIKNSKINVENEENLLEAFDVLIEQLSGDRIIKTNPTPIKNQPTK